LLKKQEQGLKIRRNHHRCDRPKQFLPFHSTHPSLFLPAGISILLLEKQNKYLAGSSSSVAEWTSAKQRKEREEEEGGRMEEGKKFWCRKQSFGRSYS
jgi:hypothetical protein